MTKDERLRKVAAINFVILISCFFSHSSFVIRHSRSPLRKIGQFE